MKVAQSFHGNRSLKRTRGYVLAPWQGFPAAPLSSGVGLGWVPLSRRGDPFEPVGPFRRDAQILSHWVSHSGSLQMALTDQQVASIIFNETRSLSGDDIAQVRKSIAYSIINAQASTGCRPETGPTVAHVPKQETEIYTACTEAVTAAHAERAKGADPTRGATNFNFRKNNWRGDFYGLKIQTQVGPLDNSYPTADLPASNIYANTYRK